MDTSDVTKDDVTEECLWGSASQGPFSWGTYGSVFLTIFGYPFWVGTNLEMISSHCPVWRQKKRGRKNETAWVHTRWPGVKPGPPSSGSRDFYFFTCFKIKNLKPSCRRDFFFLWALHIVNSSKDREILASLSTSQVCASRQWNGFAVVPVERDIHGNGLSFILFLLSCLLCYTRKS